MVSGIFASRRDGNEKLTIDDDKEIDAQYREALADLVVGVLEVALHDGGVDLDDNDAHQTGEDHPVSEKHISIAHTIRATVSFSNTEKSPEKEVVKVVLVDLLPATPLVSQEPGGQDVGGERNGAVDCGKDEDHVAADAEGLEQDCCARVRDTDVSRSPI